MLNLVKDGVKDSASAPSDRERVSTHPIPPIGVEKDYHLINRELSWLAFNERVLAEAENPDYPLLERLRFIAISASNLDEFFMVRVAGLKQQVARGISYVKKRLPPPEDQLKAIDQRIKYLLEHQKMVLSQLLTELSASGVTLVDEKTLTEADHEFMRDYINSNVMAVIAPQAIDPAHPFPFIANRGFGMFLSLVDQKSRSKQALIMLPAVVQRFIRLPGETSRFIPLEKAILLNLQEIFPKHKLTDQVTFRLLRDSELEVDEDAEDLVATFEDALRARKRGNVISMQLSCEKANDFSNTLINNVLIDPSDVHYVGGMIGLADLSGMCNAGSDDLRFPPMTPRFPERIMDYGGDCFAAIKSKDILVHHPYESFDVVLRFLRQAADDPKVLSIRQTLYRTLSDSPIVRALILAAESGKSVTAMVEIKARFDEEANIKLARALERAGVQVVYGFVDLKTHAKLSLVVRQEESGLRSYAHCGTGNYHPVNAKVYTDVSFFTCDPQICSDVVRIFNFMTSYVKPEKLHKMIYAPVTARPMIKAAIKNEIAAAKRGEPSGIWFKVNSLVDKGIILLLYKASRAGVPVDLVVRGICCLRPGVPNLSENIRVRSLIGRFLEHSRIYVFANGKTLPSSAAKVYISSADVMPRNFDRRVETFVPIENPTVHRQIIDQIMTANLNDTRNSWAMSSDGRYVRVPDDPKKSFSAHHFFMTNPSLSGRGSALKKRHEKPTTSD